MLGLLLLYPRLRDAFTFTRPVLAWLWQGFAAALAVQIGILPVQMHFYGSIPLASLGVNVVIIAVMTLAMGAYWVTLAALAIPGLRDFVGQLTGRMTEQLLAVLRFLSGHLGGALRTPTVSLLTLLGWLMLLLGLGVLLHPAQKRLRRVLALGGAIALVLGTLRLPHTDSCYIQFSGGEADGALLHDRDAVILIDTGEYARTVSTYLQRRALRVDALILTHLHIDHAGGIRGLLDAGVPVDVCYLPEGAFTAVDADAEVVALLAELEATGTRIEYLARGDVLTTPTGQITVLWPQSGTVRNGHTANDHSLVLLVDIQGTKLLLAADVTSAYEMYAAVPADVLKAAHHGSTGSTSTEFLASVRPQLILLSCGEEAREATLTRRTGGIPICSTHTGGAITLNFTEDAFTVETYLPR